MTIATGSVRRQSRPSPSFRRRYFRSLTDTPGDGVEVLSAKRPERAAMRGLNRPGFPAECSS